MNRVMFLLSAVSVGVLAATLAGALPTHYERRAARDNGMLTRLDAAIAHHPSLPPADAARGGGAETVLVAFAPGSSTLSKREQAALRTLSDAILRRIDTVAAINVIGCAAGSDAARERQLISAEQSAQVATYLVALGVPGAFISTTVNGGDTSTINHNKEGCTPQGGVVVTVEKKE